MGSICSNQTQKDVKPPADLSELLQQTEKVQYTLKYISLSHLSSFLFPIIVNERTEKLT